MTYSLPSQNTPKRGDIWHLTKRPQYHILCPVVMD